MQLKKKSSNRLNKHAFKADLNVDITVIDLNLFGSLFHIVGA